jgi:uncharacterized membrane protein YhdT
MNHNNQGKISEGGRVMLFFLLLNAVVLERGFVSNPDWYKLGYLSLPLFLISICLFAKGYHKDS